MEDTAARMGRPKFRPWKLPITVGYGEDGPGHIHDILRPGGADCWMIEYSLAGGVRVDWEGGSRRFGSGSVLCFPPGLAHDYRMEEYWNHYWITFQPRSTWDDLLSWPSLECGVMFLLLNDDIEGRMKTAFEEMVVLKSGLSPRKGELITNLLENLLLRLDAINPLVERQKIDPRIRDVLEHMRQNYSKVITISALAELSRLSESRFCHLFKSQMHRTPMQYLERYRMQRASEMLKMSSEPVSAVAERCGYDDPLYFSRIFRKHMDLSPREFRKG